VENLKRIPSDFISISGHKIFGPKGVGALMARRSGAERRPIKPIVRGGGQELGLRSGTLPVPLLVGLGKAAELAGQHHPERKEAAAQVKKKFLDGLKEVDHRVNGDPDKIQSHILNICFPGVDSEALMISVRESIAISNGSACTSSTYTPSHVLAAMGLSEEEINSSVRISWGPGITPEEVPVEELAEAVRNLS
jgi:cysteine desulfurase